MRTTTAMLLAVGCLGAICMVDPALRHGLSNGGEAAAAETAAPGRSAVIAESGIVATSQPLATQVGLDVLRRGGNAIDAAIAANAMQGVVEPASCGIGGDLFAIYWEASTGKLYGLNASGRSPYGLTIDVLREQGHEQIPDSGPLSWSVPGCVAGWEDLHKRFGKLGWSELLAPSIEYAERGFPVSPIIARQWRSAESELAAWPDSAATFLIDGHAPRAGQRFTNARLADTYRLIAQGGADAFYRGPIAEQIVEFSRGVGGYFSNGDFADHRNEWIDPVSTTYRCYTVWELPPNGQGIAALQMLNLLEAYDLASLGPAHPHYLHLLIEAKKLAFADRARFYADMSMADVPVAELISKQYAHRQRGRIDEAKSAVDVPPGDPRLVHGDTIYLCAVDKDRNCCSLIQSNYYGFGSQMVPGNLGFALQNRGCLFALDEEHPNRLEPHKRPFHTIIPALVTRDGKPLLVYGVMGGDMQPQGHVQVLINMVDFGMDVQQAGEAARIRHFGSATPTGLPADGGGTVAVEPGIPQEAVDELRRRGHRVVRQEGGAFGGYQGIFIDWKNGSLHGGSDPRKDGAAAGY